MRYLPHTDTDRRVMLDKIGVSSIDELFTTIPEKARISALDGLPDHKSELEVDRYMRRLAEKNMTAGSVPFFLGAGAYRHHVPATVDHLIQRSEFLTAYTPYQPEISQGTLQALFEFQTQVALLTGMEVANASMYDGSTACAEAVLMASRVTRRKKCVMAGGVHPQYIEASHMVAQHLGIEFAGTPKGPNLDTAAIDAIDGQTACIVVQSPNVFGEIVDLEPFAKAAHEQGALLIAVFTEAVSLGALKSPGEQGADIVVGEGQSIGVGLNFGGPYVGLFACRQKLVRQMPGRVCGETVDADGQRGYVLTLSTREQHIRRDKATSNICTNSGLCCLAFTIHMALLGEAGIRKLAMVNHEKAVQTADALAAIPGVEVINDYFFNEFTVRLPKNASDVVEALAEQNILAGVPASRLYDGSHEDLLIVAATEMVTDEDIAEFVSALKGALS